MMKTPIDFKSLVNPRILDLAEYDQMHVTLCWEQGSRLRRLMSNESSYAPPEHVQQAIINYASQANFYPEDADYAFDLRQMLADYVGLSLENITLGNGSMELLDLLFQTFVSGSEASQVIMLAPDYSAYPIRARFFGADVLEIPCVEPTAQTCEAICAAIHPKTKMVLFSRPNNPLGHVVPVELILPILEMGVLVVADEAYVELADPGTSLADLIPERENLLVLRSFSKGFGLAGLRLGYLLAHPEVIGYINKARHIFNVNLIAMAAGLAMLRDLHSVQGVIEELKRTREWLTGALGEISGLRPIPSKGNFLLIDTSDSPHPASWYVARLHEHGFVVRDFSKKRGLEPDCYFRITVGLPHDMSELVSVLQEISASFPDQLSKEQTA